MLQIYFVYAKYTGLQNSEVIMTQDEFDEKFITVKEISEILELTSAAVNIAKQKGRLPPPLYITDKFYIWDRQTVMPFIDQWKSSLEFSRRGRPAYAQL